MEWTLEIINDAYERCRLFDKQGKLLGEVTRNHTDDLFTAQAFVNNVVQYLGQFKDVEFAKRNVEQVIEVNCSPWFDLDIFQEEVRAWNAHNFDNKEYWHSFFGIVEELGELAHAELKSIQKIRNAVNPDHYAELAKDSVGDLIVFLTDFCNQKGWKLSEIIQTCWLGVSKRDWKKFPINGIDK